MTVASCHAYIAPIEVARFWRHGFVRLAGILRPREVAQLRGAMNEALETFASSPNSYDLTAAADEVWRGGRVNDQGSRQHDLDALAQAVRQARAPRLVDKVKGDIPRGKFLLDTGVWRRVRTLAEFALHGCLSRIGATLLDVSALRYYDDQLFVKQGGAVDRAAFHQDLSYFHLDGDAGCVFWIPLGQVRRGGGAMGYIPGSHLWGQVYKPNLFASPLAFPGSTGADMPDIDADPQKFGVQYVEADPGDVIVHHFLTVHGSEGNAGPAPRSAFSLRYCDADLRFRRRQGAPAQPLHRLDMKDGDLLDDEVHPIVFRSAHEYRRAS